MWIIIKSLLNISKQWFKGNTVKFVLVLNKWDLNVWYDFHNRLSFSFYGIQLFKLFFFKIPTYFKTAIQLLTHHRHHWDKLVSFSLWILYFYSWKNRISKIRLNWMTEYCIVLFFERLHFYRPHFAGITWIKMWALLRRVSMICSRWENDVHLPFQSLSNLQMNRRPNIKS